MKKFKILLFIITLWFIGGCGNSYVHEENVYDMWEYMTPQYSYDYEYNIYENGKQTDYFYETIKVFSSSEVQRESGDEQTTLTRYDNSIRVEQPNGEVVQVQRFVKIGDTDIFQSSTIHSCKADDYFRSIIIKGVEFYRVIKVACQTDSGSSDIYYGYNEGIVSIYRNENSTITEIVKVDERQLQ
ncbi:MAG TPA: hypothetical protein ENK88_02325 [Campylobacterales bacterium]|nr:hypothetical protein [Campylobacterales bacterium]HHH50958.1 hypothetical protein [Campylobacterales bacterium]